MFGKLLTKTVRCNIIIASEQMFKITEVYILVNEEKLKALDAAISNIEKQCRLEKATVR